MYRCVRLPPSVAAICKLSICPPGIRISGRDRDREPQEFLRQIESLAAAASALQADRSDAVCQAQAQDQHGKHEIGIRASRPAPNCW